MSDETEKSPPMTYTIDLRQACVDHTGQTDPEKCEIQSATITPDGERAQITVQWERE